MPSHSPHSSSGSTHENAKDSSSVQAHPDQVSVRESSSPALAETRIVLLPARTPGQQPFANLNRPPLRIRELEAIATQNSVLLNVVRINSSSDGVDAQGSGFIVGQHDNGSYVVTNRHVVLNYDPEKSRLRHEATGTMHKFLVIATGQPEIQDEIDNPLCAGADLALLKTDVKPTHPLPLISLRPDLGPLREQVSTFGYPSSVGSFRQGLFLKRIDLFAQNYSRHHRLSDMAELKGYFGASGSPVIDTRGDVVGVLDSMDEMDQEQGSITKFVPAPYLRSLLERNGVKYRFDKTSADSSGGEDRSDSPGLITMSDVQTEAPGRGL